jgi:hypothetical protein
MMAMVLLMMIMMKKMMKVRVKMMVKSEWNDEPLKAMMSPLDDIIT